MVDPPLVSVILPTYNRAHVLTRAIQSVLTQSYPHLELIVIDDGSSDDTALLINAIDDARLKFKRLDSTQGSSAARNHGIEMAKGELLAFQDSDDVWHPTKLDVQTDALARASANVAVCVCSYRHIKGDKNVEVVHKPRELDGNDVIKDLVNGAAFSTPTLVIKEPALSAVGGFDESLPRRQDYELCLRLAKKGSFVFIPEIAVDHYINIDSISADPSKFIDATEKIFRTHRASFKAHYGSRSVQLFKAAKYFAFHGCYERALRLALRAIAANPLNWKAIALLLSIMTGTVRHLEKREK